jgi:hypothetical protein
MVPLTFEITPYSVVAAGFCWSAGYFLLALVGLAAGGPVRAAARRLGRLAALPFVAGLALGGLLAVGGAVGATLAVVGAGVAALVALLPPLLAVASVVDDAAGGDVAIDS